MTKINTIIGRFPLGLVQNWRHIINDMSGPLTLAENMLRLVTLKAMNYYHPSLTRSVERAPVWVEFRVSTSE